MTAAMLASIPFWILAGTALFATIACPLHRLPGETTNSLIGQFFVCLFATGVFAALAVLVSHL